MDKQYEEYILVSEGLDDSQDIKRDKTKAFLYRPKISIITPVFNTDEKWLRLAIESVVNQVYDNWELCIADDGSTKPYIKEVLNEYAKKDKRIKVKFLNENKGIAGNSNEALSLATGEYIGFLDHDDELALASLFEIVKAINENPEGKIFYSDEAITDSSGRIICIDFRPNFARFFYLSHPYMVHLFVIKKELIEYINGFDESFSENVSHDVDLMLRLFSITKDKEIIHIPKVLYFWKHHASSAGRINQGRVHKYTRKAIGNYLKLKNIDGWVEDSLVFNTFRPRFKIKNNYKVSIIIPTKDNWQLLKKCLESIKNKTTYENYEIIVIGNNTESKEAISYLASLEEQRYKILRYDIPFNYSKINNYAVNYADGEFLLFMNDDTEVLSPDWLTSMVELIQMDEVGVVGAKLLYPNNKIQHAGVIVGLMGIAEHSHKFMNAYSSDNIPELGYLSSLVAIREYSAVTGACMMVKKNIFEDVEGLDERYSHAYNDTDLCLKIREKGYLVLYTPYAELYHHESVSRGYDDTIEKKIRYGKEVKLFHEKWSGILKKGDPYYNPNLSYNKGVFSVKDIYELLGFNNLNLNLNPNLNLNKALVDKDVHISNLEGAINNKDAHISNLETHADNLEKSIKAKDTHISNLEGAINNKDAHISNLETHADNLEKSIKSKDTHILNLEGAINNKDAHISNLETHADNLEKSIKSKDTHILNLEETVRAKDLHILNIEAMVKDKEVSLNNIYNSTGWKMLQVLYRVRDLLLPPNARRKLFVKKVISSRK